MIGDDGGMMYTLNSIISHLWQAKVHVILRIYAVMTWMRDKKRFSVACGIIETNKFNMAIMTKFKMMTRINI